MWSCNPKANSRGTSASAETRSCSGNCCAESASSSKRAGSWERGTAAKQAKIALAACSTAARENNAESRQFSREKLSRALCSERLPKASRYDAPTAGVRAALLPRSPPNRCAWAIASSPRSSPERVTTPPARYAAGSTPSGEPSNHQDRKAPSHPERYPDRWARCRAHTLGAKGLGRKRKVRQVRALAPVRRPPARTDRQAGLLQ